MPLNASEILFVENFFYNEKEIYSTFFIVFKLSKKFLTNKKKSNFFYFSRCNIWLLRRQRGRAELPRKLCNLCIEEKRRRLVGGCDGWDYRTLSRELRWAMCLKKDCSNYFSFIFFNEFIATNSQGIPSIRSFTFLLFLFKFTIISTSSVSFTFIFYFLFFRESTEFRRNIYIYQKCWCGNLVQPAYWVACEVRSAKYAIYMR